MGKRDFYGHRTHRRVMWQNIGIGVLALGVIGMITYLLLGQ